MGTPINSHLELLESGKSFDSTSSVKEVNGPSSLHLQTLLDGLIISSTSCLFGPQMELIPEQAYGIIHHSSLNKHSKDTKIVFLFYILY